jgi:hypothetical protein
MYSTTTTTPDVVLSANLVGNGSISATAVPRRRRTPEAIQEYLHSMGWTPYSASDGDWMYTRPDIGSGGYMTWEQAVVYCLVNPFLTEKNT